MIKTVKDLIVGLELIVPLQVELGNVKDLKEIVDIEIAKKIEEYIMCEPNLFEMKHFDKIIEIEGYKKEELEELFECVYFNKNDKYFKMTDDGCFESFSIVPELFFEQLEDIEKEIIFKKVLEKYLEK